MWSASRRRIGNWQMARGFGGISMYASQTAYAPTKAQSDVLLQRVCFLLASGLIVSAVAAWVFQDAFALMLPFMIGTFVMLFVMRAVAQRPGVNVLAFYVFCLAEGGLLGPLLSQYARFFGPGIIAEAFLLTSIAVAGVGGYAYTSGRDFGFLGRTLMWSLVGVILISFLGYFAFAMNPGMTMDHRLFSLALNIGIVALFTGFLLYDFSNIRLRYGPQDYTMAAVSVYLDFLNLFLAILNILAMLSGNGGIRRR